jgi:hypothetical protein
MKSTTTETSFERVETAVIMADTDTDDTDTDESVEDIITEFIHERLHTADVFKGVSFIHLDFPHPEHSAGQPPVKGMFPIADDGTRLRNGTVRVTIQDDNEEWHQVEREVYAEDDLYSAIRAAE